MEYYIVLVLYNVLGLRTVLAADHARFVVRSSATTEWKRREGYGALTSPLCLAALRAKWRVVQIVLRIHCVNCVQ